MRIDRIEGGARERVTLIGMITDENVLAKIAPKWTAQGLLSSPWSNLLGKWAVDYYLKYATAPGRAIANLYENWAETASDKATSDLLSRFLRDLSDEYDTTPAQRNSDYVLAEADTHFNTVAIQQLKDALDADLANGDIAKAQTRIGSFGGLSVGGDAGIDVFSDYDALTRAFSKKTDPIVEYGGDLGRLINPALERDAFVAFHAANKAGKSFWLQDLVFRAVFQRRRVSYFQVGDMSQSQVLLRMGCRAAGIPTSSRDGRWPCKIKIPKSIKRNSGAPLAEVEFDEKEFDYPLDVNEAIEAFKQVQKRRIKSDNSYLKLYCYPNSTISVKGIESVIDADARKGFLPDVVCIASGSKVLTEKGLVSIENIRRSDRLWDGTDWVTHDGLVYKGERDVITYDGLTATPDHLIHTSQGWRSLITCRRMGLRATKTGDGGRAVRISENHIPDDSYKTIQVEGGKDGQKILCICRMCQMQISKMDDVFESKERYRQRMSNLSSTKAISDVVMEKGFQCESKMHRQYPQSLGSLWREGYRVPFQVCNGCLFVDSRQSRNRQVEGYRQNRQQWTLRAGKPEIVYEKTKHSTYNKKGHYTSITQIQNIVPLCDLCGRYTQEIPWKDDIQPNTGKMEFKTHKTKVWDILNAGPLHRFTVQGVLAHNCIDYADILAPITKSLPTIEQINETWRALRGLSQKKHVLLVTASQANAASFSAKTLTRKNFSGSNLKFAEVTAAFGINQYEEEKELQIQRINVLNAREFAYDDNVCVHVAGCLALADPAMHSTF